MKYFLLSLLSYFVYHNIIAPLFQSPTPPPQNNTKREDNTFYNETKKKQNRNDDDFAEYEEIK